MKMGRPRKPEAWIEEQVRVFTDPLIAFPGGWEMQVEALRNEIILDREIRLMEALKDESKLDMATLTEAAGYISSASLCAPLDHDWTDIFMYCFNHAMGLRGINVADIDETLVMPELRSQWLEAQLDRLRRWIREQQTKAYKKAKKLEARREAEAPQPAALVFDF